MEKMKAVLYDKKGYPEKFINCVIDKPVPADNQVLIKIHAVSLNAVDYRAMKMGFIPKNKIFGSDIAGIIEAVGKDVSQFKPGDKVIGCLLHFGYGGFAEYVAVSSKAVVKKPELVSFEDGSTLAVAGVTALYALRDKGKIKQSDKVLIVGSAGSVGPFAVQLGKYFGAEVTGVCSTSNIEKTLALGADYAIDYTKNSFLKQGKYYDIILGINGNYSLFAYRKTLAKNGKFVLIGGAMSQIIKTILFGRILSFGGKKMTNSAAWELNSDIEILAKLVEKRILKPSIEKRYPLDQTADAMKYVSQGHSSGKVVIIVQ